VPHYTYDEPEDRQYVVLEPGEYDFVIAEVFAFETAKTGNEYLPLKLHIKPEGTVFDNLVFTDKAKFRIDQLLKSIGKAPPPGSSVDFDDPSWLVGCKGRCQLVVDEYKGKKKNKVEAYVFTPGTVAGRKVSAATPAPSAKSAPQKPAGTGFEDDEPF
jgi:hypothetical protein